MLDFVGSEAILDEGEVRSVKKLFAVRAFYQVPVILCGIMGDMKRYDRPCPPPSNKLALEELNSRICIADFSAAIHGNAHRQPVSDPADVISVNVRYQNSINAYRFVICGLEYLLVVDSAIKDQRMFTALEDVAVPYASCSDGIKAQR